VPFIINLSCAPLMPGVSIDPKICHGQACIKGTRIPVYQIVRMLANGDSFESLLKAYPTIEREDISACLEYAAWLAEEQIAPTGLAISKPLTFDIDCSPLDSSVSRACRSL
jgi:uncharacterized protein (DUF433 family)